MSVGIFFAADVYGAADGTFTQHPPSTTPQGLQHSDVTDMPREAGKDIFGVLPLLITTGILLAHPVMARSANLGQRLHDGDHPKRMSHKFRRS